MSKELIISSTRHENRVALLEDDQVVEVYHQREREYSLAGSIHKGRVTRVLPGMQSAFVDIGLERDAFLYVSDFFEDNEEYDKIVSSVEDTVLRLEKAAAVPAPAGEAPRGETAEKTEPEPAPAAAVAVARPALPGVERKEEGERRDRRGRRSRRRRSHSRGLPESKYFAPPHHAAAPPAAPSPPAQIVAPTRSGEFSVLPGESLAKYRRGDHEPETQNAAESVIEHTPEPAPSEAVPDADTEPVVVAPEMETSPPEDSGQIESAGETAAVEEVAEQGQAAEGPATVEAADSGEPAATEGPEPARIPTSLTATLRDHGSRYMHRISRRMRNKIRSAAAAEERRPEPETKTVAPRPERGPAPSISDLLREGQEIIVQIAKEPLGQKGARITSHIALPGRYLVYMPTVDHIGVSRKIADDNERARLKRILQAHRAGIPGGYIVRTAGEGKSEEELRSDMLFLYNLWLDIRQKAEKKSAPALIHHDLDLVQRILRDQLNPSFKSIWADNEEVYENVLSFVQRFQPALVGRVKLYTRSNPIFDQFNVSSELEKALRPKVWLKSGGYIVINQTEALVAIDVNTGKYVGKSNRLEDTIVKTNTDAIKEIVRQIRLRDLGGIIVVDFIDMDERKNRQKVMQALEEAMRADRAPYKILQYNDFGLVAITRKRVKQSLERTLCSPCPYCEGAGYIKSVQTVIGEILQEAHKVARALEGPDVVLRVHPEVARVLKSNRNDYLQEIEEILGKSVIVKGDPLLHQEKFDLA